ncbi:hypothetical protein [Flammeovirga sp. SJP92]|uniref:hypothetical protein n=1 Tax=Flammeovirga sp. SJP92 TaxID=1775430 RepID=UPI00078915F5|nr:hypothetical protein [Flammeovirga sp. SJP92]KXX67812.1 hypothetical protein AVL50_25455 [Flammeovirga sp. SJP92]
MKNFIYIFLFTLFPLSLFSQVDEIILQRPEMNGAVKKIIRINKDSVQTRSYILDSLITEQNITDTCKPNFDEIVRMAMLIEKDTIIQYYFRDPGYDNDTFIISLYEKGHRIRQITKILVFDSEKSEKPNIDNDLILIRNIFLSYCINLSRQELLKRLPKDYK